MANKKIGTEPGKVSKNRDRTAPPLRSSFMSSGFDSMEEEGSTRRDGGGMHALSSAPRGGPDRYSHTLEGSPAPRRSALAGRTDGERSEQSSDAALTADYSSGGASSDSSDGFRVVGGARRDPFKTIESHYADVEQLLMEYGTDAFSGEDAHRRSVQLRDLIAQIDARFISVLERRPEAVQGVKRKSHPAKITSFRRKVRGLDDQVLPNGTIVVLCPHASDCLSKYQLELFTSGEFVSRASACPRCSPSFPKGWREAVTLPPAAIPLTACSPPNPSTTLLSHR